MVQCYPEETLPVTCQLRVQFQTSLYLGKDNVPKKIKPVHNKSNCQYVLWPDQLLPQIIFVSPTSSKSTTASSSSNSKEEITNVKVALNWQPSAVSETKSTLITNVLEVTNIPKRSYSNHR